jgi:hypothetical protein
MPCIFIFIIIFFLYTKHDLVPESLEMREKV